MLTSILAKSRMRGCSALLCLSVAASSAYAADPVKVKFSLDWRFEGPSAPFLMAKAKGYFSQEGLDVQIDSGNGSAGAVTRVATGAYDMAFADINALIEQESRHPGTGVKGVYMLYNATPAAIFALKSSGMTTPADLKDKTLAAPVFDAARKSWPVFAQKTGLDKDAVTWQSADPTVTANLLVRKNVDAIAGFSFTNLLNLEARGVKADDLVVFPYADYGVDLYGNTLIASKAMLENHPDAVKAFLRAFNKAVQETLADPASAARYVKEQDPLVDLSLETRRLQLAFGQRVVTPETRRNGLGDVETQRFSRSIGEVISAFGLTETPEAEAVFTRALLPERAARSVR
ncbi:taurine ABC transporter permease [Lonsdalea populi]|uniref:Taurine ABC transporter permease n=3 Tax=Lonsdalea TaxID=1082702 RepID=A0ACD1J9P2_9GAMM|nr:MULTISPECIES: ABC transporter substrate-binding protein [Lonsdalea]OSM95674.1 taurine ABC transporter permease [Lonsdalea populi]QPQ25879.1 ABC transporter substrate-binding protein [Lonsdalea populi]RAT11819.1 taurine ABC transporter permease [Lonsdalea quercina]RAT21632.1 taurine ABC transporter permease [Lonsdalea populi]RAT22368.1 taurine ABC transporter permease [Lonsdalea populi]